MEFQILSDLHLKKNDFIFTQTAEYLILAGDIGYPFTSIFWLFIEYVSRKYRQVFFIPGNHEFYGYTMEVIESFLRMSFKRYPNVFYMNNDVFEFDKVVLLGTILWSPIPKEICKLHTFGIHKKIIDFSVGKRNKKFIANCAWIETQVERFKGRKKIILITHYAPLLHESCNPKYDGDFKNHDYGVNLHERIQTKNIDFFIYGHTHYNYKGNILNLHDNTYISNQRGIKPSDNFDLGFKIKI